MKEGAYIFQFGLNQSVRIYYCRSNYHLEVDPQFKFGKDETINFSSQASLSSQPHIDLKLDYPNFRSCMDHVFEEYGTNENATKSVIKCEVLNTSSSNSSESYFTHLKFNAPNFIQCSWFWNLKNNSFRISYTVKDTSDTEYLAQTSDINLHNNEFVAALTCELGQWQKTGGTRKRIKFALPFIIGHVFQSPPTKRVDSLGNSSKSSWVAFTSIMAVVLVFATALTYYLTTVCCYRQTLLPSNRLK